MGKIYSDDSILVDMSKPTKKCLACEKLFNITSIRNGAKVKYCPRVHYSYCEICGSRFEISRESLQNNSKIKTTCSRKCVAAKVNKTVAQKYGLDHIDNVSQVAEINQKISASVKDKSKDILAKARATMAEKYGASTAMQVPGLRAKIEATNLERYGTKNPAKNSEIKKKISEALKSEEVQSKYRSTSLSHYGVEYPAQSEEVQYMMRKTCLEHYGVEFSHQLPEIAQKGTETCLEKYGVPAAFLKPEAQIKARETILENLADKFTRVSKLNQAFADKLKEYGLESEFEFYLAGKWYDLHVLDTNILIEIDPSYTHSEIPSHWMREGLDKNYHKMKTDIANEYGYRCIHIFDWDNWDKVIATIVPRTKLYARKCEIKEVIYNEVKPFIDEHHIQGATKSANISLGLYCNSDLVEVMTFGKPRYASKYQYELLRLCTKSDVTVIGGASRLFKYFISKYSPQSVLSYCDLAKFSGNVYVELGMTLDHVSPPSRIWSKGTKYLTDNLLRQRGYDQIFGTKHGKGTSNDELMLKSHWLPVYDCGQAVYIL